MKEGEILKPIEDFKDYYISNFGNVFSSKKGKLKKLSPWLDSKGNYYQIGLCKNNKRFRFLVHRLVAQTFLDNPHNYPEVNHKDNNSRNNNINNLEWCTRKYNLNQSYKTLSPVRNFSKCYLFENEHLFSSKQIIIRKI